MQQIYRIITRVGLLWPRPFYCHYDS